MTTCCLYYTAHRHAPEDLRVRFKRTNEWWNSLAFWRIAPEAFQQAMVARRLSQITGWADG